MKNILLLLLVLLPINCYTQKINNMKIPVIDSAVEIFNKETLFRKAVQIKKVNGDTIYCSSTKHSYEERDKNGNTLILFSSNIWEDNSIISGYDYSINPTIGIYKEFYSNGYIKVKGIYCLFGFKIGLWYYYNDNGALTATEDFDKGFVYDAIYIFDYCQLYNIPLHKKINGFKTKILKHTSENKSYWYIEYPDYTKQKLITIQINAKTGAVVNFFERNLPLN